MIFTLKIFKGEIILRKKSWTVFLPTEIVYLPSKEAIAENAHQEPQLPWFLTVVHKELQSTLVPETSVCLLYLRWVFLTNPKFCFISSSVLSAKSLTANLALGFLMRSSSIFIRFFIKTWSLCLYSSSDW